MKRLLLALCAPFSALVYPRICGGCGKRLGDAERGICVSCRGELEPFLYSKRLLNERFSSYFVRIDAVYAGYLFTPRSVGREIIHSLKYGRNRDAGYELGRLIALKEKIRNNDFDLIIPVPIHNRKIASRGYNQAEVIAEGVASVTGIPLCRDALRRVKWSNSQTGRYRKERLSAMRGAFDVGRHFPSNGLRLLLVDDVLTTGATLSEAAKVLQHAHPSHLAVLVATVDM